MMADYHTHYKLPMSKVTGSATVEVTVTGLRWWMLRMRVATWLIALAGYIAPIRFDINLRG